MAILDKHKTKQNSVKDYYYYNATGEFDDEQLFWIAMGFYNGLTEDQVAVYARPELDESIMHAILKRIIKGESPELIAKRLQELL